MKDEHLREADTAGYGGVKSWVSAMNTHIDRVTVGTLVGLVAAGSTRDEILAMYPYLEGEDIRAALEYAAWRVDEVERPFTTRSA